MLNWIDVTSSFSEDSRHWKGLYLEICEVAEDEIECSLFSNESGEWEIYFNYGIMHGISYSTGEEARLQRIQMMREIGEEFEKSGMEPSTDFINAFCEKYNVDILHAYF